MKNNIILYTDQYSFFGRKVKAWLTKHGFKFAEKDVSEEKYTEELFDVSDQYAIPVTLVNEEVILGYDEKKLSRLLLNK